VEWPKREKEGPIDVSVFILEIGEEESEKEKEETTPASFGAGKCERRRRSGLQAHEEDHLVKTRGGKNRLVRTSEKGSLPGRGEKKGPSRSV